MRYDFCLLLCRPISSVGLNTGSVRPIGYANTGFVSRFCPPAIRALVSPYLTRWAQYGLLFNTHNAPNTSLQPLREFLALGAFTFHALKLYKTPMPLSLRESLALGAFAFHALKLYETPMPLPLRG